MLETSDTANFAKMRNLVVAKVYHLHVPIRFNGLAPVQHVVVCYELCKGCRVE